MYNFSENGFKFALSDEGKPIEGFLNDNKQARILFMLKEPNNDAQPDFWFWNVVYDEYDNKISKYFRTKKAMKYYNTFSALARKILNEPYNVDILKSCAYMNMYPYNGEGWVKKGGGYKAMINRMNPPKRNGRKASAEKQNETVNMISEEQKIENTKKVEERIVQLKGLIYDFIENGTEHIVTVSEIYSILKDKFGLVSEEEEGYLEIKLNNKSKIKTFKKCRLNHNGKIIHLYSFWHPAYPTYKLSYLQKALPEFYIETPPHF